MHNVIFRLISTTHFLENRFTNLERKRHWIAVNNHQHRTNDLLLLLTDSSKTDNDRKTG